PAVAGTVRHTAFRDQRFRNLRGTCMRYLRTMEKRMPYRPALALLLAACVAPVAAQTHAAHDPQLRASQPEPPPIASPMAVPLDAQARAGLPRHAVQATAHGRALDCEGVALADLFRAAGAMPEELRGPHLARYVLVTARDGYRAVFSLAELDPSLGNHAVVLVDRCDGEALDDEAGPLRLVAPGESRPARWVRQVESIAVVVAP